MTEEIPQINPDDPVNPDWLKLYTQPGLWRRLGLKKKLEVLELRLLQATEDRGRGAGHRLNAINKLIEHLQKGRLNPDGASGASGGGTAGQSDRFGEELDGFQ